MTEEELCIGRDPGLESPVSFDPQHYAAFLERMGHTVREASGIYWCRTQRGVYSSFPYHRDVDARNLDLRHVLKSDGLVARFGCPVEQGVPSFRILCTDGSYDFPALRSRTRTQVRRGMEACRVEQVDFSCLRQHAIPLNADTLIRQGRKVPADLQSYWTRYYAEASCTPGAEAWGAFVGSELAAFLIAFQLEDVANLLILRSSLKFLDVFPNNALVFQYLYHTLRREGVRMVSYGYQSIQSDLESLDQFKTGMGFQKVPAGQRIELTGWLKLLVNSRTSSLARRIVSAVTTGENAAKLQGILAWYQDQPSLRSEVRAA